MRHKFSLLWSWFVWALTFFLPDFPLSMRARGFLYSLGMQASGRNFQVASSCRLISMDTLSVGNDVYLAPNVIINGGAPIIIGDEVMIGFGSILVSGNHTAIAGSYRWGKREEKPIEIGQGCWLGAGCVVLAGSTLAAGSLVAAGSIVRSNLSPTGLFGGVPARRIK